MKRAAGFWVLVAVIMLAVGCSVMDGFLNQDDINKAANGPASNGGGSYSSSVPDTTPPVTAITSPADGSEIAPNTTIWGTCSDNVGVLSVTVYYFTNNGTTNFIGANLANGTNFNTPQLPNLAYGNYTFFAKAQDAAFNSGLSALFHFIVSAIPSVNFASPLSNGATLVTNVAALTFSGPATVSNANITNVTFIQSASGNTNTFAATTNSTWTYNATLTTNVLNTVSVFARSDNGKTSQTNTAYVLVDTIPPSVSFAPAPPAYTNTGNLQIIFNKSDAVSGLNSNRLYYTLNGGSPTNLLITDPTINLSGLSDNNYTLRLFAFDNAGNSNSVSASFGVDTTPPVVTISPTTAYTNLATFNIPVTITDAISGVYSSYFEIDANSPILITNSNIIATALSQGSHTFYCWSTDNIGNTSATNSRTIFVDTVKPTMTFNPSPLPGSIYNTQYFSPTNAFSFPLTIVESGSGIVDREYRVSNSGSSGTYSPFTGSNINLTGLINNKTNTVWWWSVDAAGNYSVTNSQQIVVDTIAPKITSLTYDDPFDQFSTTSWTNSGTITENFYIQKLVVSFIRQNTLVFTDLGLSTSWSYVFDFPYEYGSSETATFTINDLAGNTYTTNVDFVVIY